MQVILRDWMLEDAPQLMRLADNPKVGRYLRDFFPSPYRLEDANHYIALCLAHRDAGQLNYAIEVDGLLAGSISVLGQSDIHRKSAEIGYWLGEPFWGQGVMPRAVERICQEAFARLDVVRIYAEVFAPNKASARVLEKSGFYLEAVLKNSLCKGERLYDGLIYARMREGAKG